MKFNIVLVDYENVQPENLQKLDPNQFKVIVFIGPNQKNIPVDLAVSMQYLGENAKYVQLNKGGKNALDFHIAFYLGKLSKDYPNGYFHVISKDTGFDPLIEFLKTQKIFCTRSSSIGGMPIFKLSDVKTVKEKVKLYVDRFSNPNVSKPRKQETLFNSINSFFKKELDQNTTTEIIKEMEKIKFIKNDNGKITYI